MQFKHLDKDSFIIPQFEGQLLDYHCNHVGSRKKYNRIQKDKNSSSKDNNENYMCNDQMTPIGYKYLIESFITPICFICFI